MKQYLLIVGLLVSIAANVFFFGYKGWTYMENKIKLQGANEALVIIASRALRDGKVILKLKDRDIALVLEKPKNAPAIPFIPSSPKTPDSNNIAE